MNVRPPLKCRSQDDVIRNLDSDYEQSYLSVDVRGVSQPILHQKEFYKRLATIENIIYVDVLVSDVAETYDHIVLYQLNIFKNLIIQCRSDSQGAKVYIKEFGKPSFVGNHDEDEFSEATLISHLKDKDKFGMSLIMKALKSNLIGMDQNLSTAVIDLNKYFGGERLVDYAVRHNNVLVVRFLSLYRGDLLKPNSVTGVSPLESSITHAGRDVLAALLQLHFPIATDRIQNPKQTLTQFNTLRKQLFITAVENNRHDIVAFLVQCTDDQDIKNLITQFMKEKQYSTVLALLKADAVYPNRFSLKGIDDSVSGSAQLKAFVNERDELHEFIANGDLEEVKQRLNTGSKYYLNEDNESAAATAFNSVKIENYVFLWSKGIVVRDDKEKRIILNVHQQRELQDKLIEYFKDIGESCIPYLMSKSRLPQSQLDNQRRVQIEDCYKTLSKTDEIAAVFAVLKFSYYLDIIFDFESDTTVTIAPLSCSSQGIYYPEFGRIYFGAKISHRELLGTIAHEFTHLASELLYNNECKPYSSVDQINKTKFTEVIDNVRAFTSSSPCDCIISSVFSSYGLSAWPAELIARVNEMLGKHGSDEGRRLLETQAKQLLEYYDGKMRPDCLKYVSESHLIKPRNTIHLLNLYSGVINGIEEINIQYTSPIDLTKYLCDLIEPFLCVSASNARLGAINVHQSLTTDPSLFGSFLILNYGRYRKKDNEIILAFLTEVCRVLVVEFDSYTLDDLKIARDRLYKNLPWQSNKKFIFITAINSQELMDEGVTAVDMRNISLMDLTTDSQIRFLQKQLIFQGREVTFEMLIDANSYNIVDADILAKVLIMKQELTIGKPPPIPIGYNSQLYILRKLIYSTKISEKLVNEFSETLISNASSIIIEDNVNKMTVLGIGTTEMGFNNLCEQYPEKNIHWLKRKSNGFHWWRSRSSSESFKKLKGYLDSSFSQVYDEDSFVDSVDELRMVIVSDTAGMGKSYLLAHQAQLLKERHPHLWVIRVDLNYYTEVLEKEVEEKSLEGSDEDTVLDFFVNTLLESRNETKLETGIDKKWLMHSITKSGKVILLFDAFDELREEQQEVMIGIIKSLRQTKIKQMWLTTRPYAMENLEKELQQFSHSMVPFSKKVQLRFLKNFWGRDLDNKDRVELYAKAVVHRLSESIKDRERQLTGIPLQIMMVADNKTFKEQCNAFHNSNESEPILSDRLDFIGLYDSFIDNKLNIYHFDKTGSSVTTRQADSIKKHSYPMLKLEHQSPALLALFNTKEQSVFGNIKKEDVECLFEYGLIVSEVDHKPLFIHRTFAEYFAADYLLSILISGDLSTRFIDFLVQQILFSYQWATIRAFIDGRLSDNKILIDDLVGRLRSAADISKISTLRLLFHASNDSNVNLFKFIFDTFKAENCKGLLHNIDEDRSKRLFLWSVRTSSMKVTEKWIDSGIDINCKPIGNWDFLRPILDDKKKESIWLRFASSVFETEEAPSLYNLNGCAALHIGAMYGQKETVEMLLKRGADVNITDDNGVTPLHVAAWFGHIEILEILIKYGANMNAVHDGGDTALCDAIYFQNADVIEYFINLDGFDINGNHANGVTPLHMAAVYGYESNLKFLLDKGVEIDVKIDFNCVTQKKRKKIIWDIVDFCKTNNADEIWGIPLHLALFRKDNKNSNLLKVYNAKAPQSPVPQNHSLIMALDKEITKVQNFKHRSKWEWWAYELNKRKNDKY